MTLFNVKMRRFNPNLFFFIQSYLFKILDSNLIWFGIGIFEYDFAQPQLNRSIHGSLAAMDKNSWFESLKGSFTMFLFSIRTHILDINEVWYS